MGKKPASGRPVPEGIRKKEKKPKTKKQKKAKGKG